MNNRGISNKKQKQISFIVVAVSTENDENWRNLLA